MTSDDLIAYLRALPAADVPRVVVPGNAGLHVSKATKAARPALARLGTYLYYLPPYSPGRNEIEAVFGQVEHHEIPQRNLLSPFRDASGVEQGPVLS